LPETLLDRFLLKVEMQAPDEDELEVILQRTTESDIPVVTPVMSAERVTEIAAIASEIGVPPECRKLAVRIVAATRPDHPAAPASVKSYVRRGASPRGAQAMVLAAKARALFAGRGEVLAADIRAAAAAALGHRLALSFEGHAADACPADIVGDVLESVRA
jgi:MoxR-like ATPase